MNPYVAEQSKRAKIERQAKAFYASPAGQRQLRICAAFSAKWQRELRELEAERALVAFHP